MEKKTGNPVKLWNGVNKLRERVVITGEHNVTFNVLIRDEELNCYLPYELDVYT